MTGGPGEALAIDPHRTKRQRCHRPQNPGDHRIHLSELLVHLSVKILVVCGKFNRLDVVLGVMEGGGRSSFQLPSM